MPELTNEEQEFYNKIKYDPAFAASIKRKAELEDFKSTYKVTNSSSLKCPACTTQFGGTLWWNPSEPNKFVCRKCKLEFSIAVFGKKMEDLVKEVKELNKS